jgi:hypothetical protein
LIDSEIATIPIASDYIAYNSTNNLIYTSDLSSNNISIIDCNTNTFVGIIALNNPIFLQYCPSNNFLYIANNGGIEIAIINCSNNLLVNTLTIPLGIGTLTYSVYDNVENNIYWGTFLGYNLVISCTNNLIIYNFFLGASIVTTGVYNALQNSVYFSLPFLNLIYQVTTIGVTTTPYYISSSSNYNLFLQSLEYEPIKVDYIRVIANQTQLANNLAIYKIDSSGKSNQVPNFPILGVNAWQDQGNISLIKFKDLIFDGRTYISQYVINANQTLILELFYSQFDLRNFKNILDAIMPIKVPLKAFFDDYTEL